MSNLHTVQEIYAAFGRGDVETILAKLADDVDWEYGHPGSEVPWLERRRGRDGAAEFFASLAALDFHVFRPKEMLADGPVVVALVDVEFTVKETGRRVAEEEEIHVWRFDEAGLVARFRHGVDSHRHHLALHGPSTSRS
jgi:ketosteroid isomerase-like protein